MTNRKKFLIVVCLSLTALLTACIKYASQPPSPESHSIEEKISQGTSSIGTSDFLLGPEDVLDVLVWKNQDLSRTVAIRPDGKISLPLIGDVQAAGVTTSQLRDSIKQHLKEYKETPEVSVILKEINSLSVFIMGEVVKPGKLQLRTEATLLQAITLSGGFTQYANSDKILLLRREGGHETRRRISYKEIVNGKNPEANVILKSGDTIVVP
jgi:polysaccharide export outer membrane protein